MSTLDKQKAQVMYKLARKHNWGHKYDRLEHFKRFSQLDAVVKALTKKQFLLCYKKPTFVGIALNPQYKQQIITFIEKQLPYLKGSIK